MATTLVIVESATKAKKIQEYLGKDFKVLASFGHVRDLKKVDPPNNFALQYGITKPDQVETIKAAFVKCGGNVILASDADREGEAIAWHLAQVLKVNPETVRRIVFKEITKPAIKNAVKNPRTIDMNMVNSQQARRVLDMLLGFELSPLLIHQFNNRGLSAGRVQSIVARLITDRERKIMEFAPESYFGGEGVFQVDAEKEFKADLLNELKTIDETMRVLQICKTSEEFVVRDIITTVRTQTPSAPFETASMQQTAGRLLKMTAQGVMSSAQKLYEHGLITYHRTDCTTMSKEAMTTIAELVRGQYGEEYYCERVHNTVAEDAQEAHEAIRPTNFSVRTPPIQEDIELSGGDRRLYELIWKRAVGSQMAIAQFAVFKAHLSPSIQSAGAEEGKKAVLFEASAEDMIFPGFLILDEIEAAGADEVARDAVIKGLSIGQIVRRKVIKMKEKLTQTSPRFTEPTLVKELKRNKIGRPSTYATMVNKVQEREYVRVGSTDGREVKLRRFIINESSEILERVELVKVGADKERLIPTDLGKTITEYLCTHFPLIMDYEFTAMMEEQLDKVASGQTEWLSVVANYYKAFHPIVISLQEPLNARRFNKRLVGTHFSGVSMFAYVSKSGQPLLQIGVEKESLKYVEITPEQLSTITEEDANKLIVFPLVLGTYEGFGEVVLNKGKFGLYVKCGELTASVSEATLEAAVRALQEKTEKNKLVIKKVGSAVIRNGPHGPYVLMDGKIAGVPVGVDPASLTEKDCRELFKNKQSGTQKFDTKRGKRGKGKKA